MLLKNALCVALSPPALERDDVRITGGTVEEVGRGLAAKPGEETEDLAGKIVMPGLVCAHTHLISTLSRGMPPPAATPANFPEILERIWWRLDRALDRETLYCSAVAGALEAARCGVTTIVDHHSSPNAISGSLDAVRRGIAEIGLRGILCYEISDRGGPDRRDEGLAENEAFAADHRTDPMFRGCIGGHASFTLSDESLRSMGDLAERHGTGVHIHLAEAVDDPRITEEKFGRSILERFEEFGILRRNSLLAHCVHCAPDEFSRLRECGAWLIHNPRSNMNNGVGRAPLAEFGSRRALGTDGFPPDLFEEMRSAHLRGNEAGDDAEALRMAANGQAIASEMFGREFRTLTRGAAADLIVMDYIPPTPLTGGNLASHILFGLRSSMVESVMVNGNWVVRNRRFPGLDESALLRGAEEAATKLWSAMHALES